MIAFGLSDIGISLDISQCEMELGLRSVSPSVPKFPTYDGNFIKSSLTFDSAIDTRLISEIILHFTPFVSNLFSYKTLYRY